MNRDQVRQGLKDAGVTCHSVSDDELKRLRKLISKHLRLSGIYNGTARLVRARKNLKFIEIKTENWDRREAVSFNRDGFIGIAGWADNKNVKPLLSALIEWTITPNKKNLNTNCDCWQCHRDKNKIIDRMILCPDCGNKRCPKANNHRNICTQSNELGQSRSAYS